MSIAPDFLFLGMVALNVALLLHNLDTIKKWGESSQRWYELNRTSSQQWYELASDLERQLREKEADNG